MKDLWFKTIRLSRNYPYLWTPVVFVAFLSYCWRIAGQILLRHVLLWSEQSSSVLGGSYGTGSTKRHWLTYLPVPGFQLVDACCYVVAMFVTVKLAGRILTRDRTLETLGDISIFMRAFFVIWFGFLACILSIASFSLMFLPISSFAMSRHHTSWISSPYFVAVQVLPMYCALAYLLTPIALRMLDGSSIKPIRPIDLDLGRKAAILAGFAIVAISIPMLSFGRSFHGDSGQATTFAIISTILSSLPYAPLFIAFSILTIDRRLSVSDGDPNLVAAAKEDEF